MSELPSLAPADAGDSSSSTFLAASSAPPLSTEPHIFTDAQIEEYKEQDRYLPIANVGRIMKNSLPDNAKIAKEAKECVQECVSEFISFLSSEAAEKVATDKRKTINGEDVLYSMVTLGFDNYAEACKIYLAKYRNYQQENQPHRNTLSRLNSPDLYPLAATAAASSSSLSTPAAFPSAHTSPPSRRDVDVDADANAEVYGNDTKSRSPSSSSSASLEHGQEQQENDEHGTAVSAKGRGKRTVSEISARDGDGEGEDSELAADEGFLQMQEEEEEEGNEETIRQIGSYPNSNNEEQEQEHEDVDEDQGPDVDADEVSDEQGHATKRQRRE